MNASPSGELRASEWAARAIQWQPARNAVKRGVHRYAGLRARVLEARGGVAPVANIFAAGSPKSGSQWVKTVFDHGLVRAHTRLLTLPQLDHQLRLHRAFPVGTFVPGLYVSYPEYRQIPKQGNHRCIYIFRDPRAIVVSAYFSVTETHRALPHIVELRNELQQLSVEAGVLRTLEVMAPRLREMGTWVDTVDSEVAPFRLEEIGSDPRAEMARMLKHCNINLSTVDFETVLEDTSRSSLQRRDLAMRVSGSDSHYRLQPTHFQTHFTHEHYEVLERLVPGLVARLGYPE